MSLSSTATASSSPPPRPVLPPDWRAVPLTEAEVQAAHDAARQAKWQSIKNAQYVWDISYPAPKQAVTFKHLLTAKLREAETQGLRYEGAARQVLEQLAWYFSDDGVLPLPEGWDGPDPDKGLLLAGPVGCGKTTLLRLFMRNPAQKFGVVSARTVASAYQTKGAPGLEAYLTAHHSGGVVFDDLGTEATSVHHFGTSCNPMAEVLLARYDEFQAGRLAGIYTHLTTNLPVGEASDAPGTLSLYGLYGQRVVDRIREMFTLIAFEPTSPSLRR
jgi:hypothetical protein